MFVVLVLSLLVAVLTNDSEESLIDEGNDKVELAELDEFSNHVIDD